jgi:hypothetical protein
LCVGGFIPEDWEGALIVERDRGEEPKTKGTNFGNRVVEFE